MLTGKKLEELIKKAAIEQGIDYTRLRDAGWQGEQTTRRFTIKNICDCILFNSPFIYFIEIKHRKDSLTYDSITQLDDLRKKHNPKEYVYAGVICMIRGSLFWLTVTAIDKMKAELGKKSFNHKDAGLYGEEINFYVPKGKRAERPDLGFI